jgi:hypothetical protein
MKKSYFERDLQEPSSVRDPASYVYRNFLSLARELGEMGSVIVHNDNGGVLQIVKEHVRRMLNYSCCNRSAFSLTYLRLYMKLAEELALKSDMNMYCISGEEMAAMRMARAEAALDFLEENAKRTEALNEEAAEVAASEVLEAWANAPTDADAAKLMISLRHVCLSVPNMQKLLTEATDRGAEKGTRYLQAAAILAVGACYGRSLDKLAATVMIGAAREMPADDLRAMAEFGAFTRGRSSFIKDLALIRTRKLAALDENLRKKLGEAVQRILGTQLVWFGLNDELEEKRLNLGVFGKVRFTKEQKMHLEEEARDIIRLVLGSYACSFSDSAILGRIYCANTGEVLEFKTDIW